MSAEFFINFEDEGWFEENRACIADAIRELEIFVREEPGVFYLRGTEGEGEPDRWWYDVRIFIDPAPPMRLEMSAHPPSVERDVSGLLNKLREHTRIRVDDEDGEPATW